MHTVGLTGGIACGKSTVAGILRNRGVPVIDADQVSREIVAPGEPALAEIVAAFGVEMLQADGTLNRKALGALVMGGSEEARVQRRRLEAITHPRIFGRIGEKLQALAREETPAAVVEAAIMVESGNHRLYSALLVVACSPAVQLKRLMDRQGFDEATAAGWIATQMPIAEKVAVADAVVSNDGDRAALEGEVDRAWAEIQQKLNG
ncbi:MAG: dephospho-CoA kinase [Myxococcota bacterium]|jgi:dephospho-CoA kinase